MRADLPVGGVGPWSTRCPLPSIVPTLARGCCGRLFEIKQKIPEVKPTMKTFGAPGKVATVSSRRSRPSASAISHRPRQALAEAPGVERPSLVLDCLRFDFNSVDE